MIGNIASVISEMDQFGAQLKARMDGLKNYLTYKKFPRAMQKRVRKTCAHYYGKKTINRPDWDKASHRRRPPAPLRRCSARSTASRGRSTPLS